MDRIGGRLEGERRGSLQELQDDGDVQGIKSLQPQAPHIVLYVDTAAVPVHFEQFPCVVLLSRGQLLPPASRYHQCIKNALDRGSRQYPCLTVHAPAAVVERIETFSSSRALVTLEEVTLCCCCSPCDRAPPLAACRLRCSNSMHDGFQTGDDLQQLLTRSSSRTLPHSYFVFLPSLLPLGLSTLDDGVYPQILRLSPSPPALDQLTCCALSFFPPSLAGASADDDRR
eukprot:459321-Hanusia_phi.AAC.3